MNYKDYIFNIKIGEASISSDSEYILLQPNSTIEFSEKIQRNNELYYFEITDKHANPRLNLLLNDVVLFAYANGMSGKIIGILIDTQNMTLKVFDENVLLNQYPISDNSSLVLLSKSTLVTSSVYIYFDNFKYNSFPQAKKLFQKPINKTLILHDDEYRRWNESTGGNYPTNDLIPIMTSDTTPSGKVTASTYTNGYEPWKAFDGNDDSVWLTRANNKSGWIAYEFPNKIIVSKYAIKGNSNGATEMPRNFTFEGSDDGVNWDVLDTQVDQMPWANMETKEYILNNTKAYLMYRLNVSLNSGSSNYLRINKLIMYGEKTPAIPASWITVSNAIPNKQQFLEEGMDSLSPLLDRRVETLEPLPMTEDSTQMESGKLFSKTLNLKKYVDIRNIKVEVE